jgi:plasmid stabilization system protein ParE
MADPRPAIIWSPEARADLSEIWDYYVQVAGQRRVQVAQFPPLARALAVTVEDLIGDAARSTRRGPSPKLLQQAAR